MITSACQRKLRKACAFQRPAPAPPAIIKSTEGNRLAVIFNMSLITAPLGEVITPIILKQIASLYFFVEQTFQRQAWLSRFKYFQQAAMLTPLGSALNIADIRRAVKSLHLIRQRICRPSSSSKETSCR